MHPGPVQTPLPEFAFTGSWYRFSRTCLRPLSSLVVRSTDRFGCALRLAATIAHSGRPWTVVFLVHTRSGWGLAVSVGHMSYRQVGMCVVAGYCNCAFRPRPRGTTSISMVGTFVIRRLAPSLDDYDCPALVRQISILKHNMDRRLVAQSNGGSNPRTETVMSSIFLLHLCPCIIYLFIIIFHSCLPSAKKIMFN